MKTFTSYFALCLLALFSFSSSMAQPLDYEWTEVTNKYMRLGSNGNNLNAYTKGGHAVVATDEGWLAESVDTGRTWQKTYDVTDVPENYSYEKENAYKPQFLSFSSDSLRGFFFATYTENDKLQSVLLHTTDGGHSWTPSSTQLETGSRISKYLWYDENTIFAIIHNNSVGNEIYMYVSKDAGNHWEKLTDNMLFGSYYDERNTFLTFVDEQLGYMFIFRGYYVTTDGGKTWTRTELGIDPDELFQFNNGQIILINGNSTTKTLPGCRIINFVDYSYNQPYYVPAYLHDLGDGVVKGLISYIGKGKYIVSTDSLRTYQETDEKYTPPTPVNEFASLVSKNTYMGNVKGKQLLVKSSNEVFVVGQGATGRLFYTKDGGETWTYKDFNTTLKKMQIFPNTMYILGKDSLFVSTDGGENWTAKTIKFQNGIDEKYLDMQFITENRGFVFDDFDLYSTKDGGDTWEHVYELNRDGVFFFEEGGIFTGGAFANDRFGLFKSDQEYFLQKDLLSIHINAEEDYEDILSLPDFIREGVIGHDYMKHSYVKKSDDSRFQQITYYKDGERWLITDLHGRLYSCDTTLNFKQVLDILPDHKPHPGNRSTTILNYGDGNIVLPMLNENELYPNDTARVSHDYGETWTYETFNTPLTNLMAKSDNPNIIYACETDRYLHVYKGVHKVKNADFSFEKQENGTIQCSISNAENQTYTAKIVVEQVNGTTIVVQDNVEIKSGESFVIALPQNITANYVIKVVPYDEEVYEMVQSQEFIVNNGGSAIDAVSADDIQIRVVNGKIECSCEDYAIYNVAGQKVQNNASLPSGTYFVHCGTQVKKVVVK
ncbi:MAG: hypothetical protein IKJ98_04575 [Bacteroidales bacterium]|nr:hypothetical protein [Bacteroidales bacterium]